MFCSEFDSLYGGRYLRAEDVSGDFVATIINVTVATSSRKDRKLSFRSKAKSEVSS